MSPETMAALEALLFASDVPLELARIAEVLELEPVEVQAAVDGLRAALAVPGRGLELVEVGGGFRLVTRPETAPALVRFQRLRLKNRLSRAALETLAIIAYRQPISRPEVEQLRGVGAESVLSHLLERRLIRVAGRRPGPGRPMLYGTTREFLEHFGLRGLEELPPFEVPRDDAAVAAASAGDVTGNGGGEPDPTPDAIAADGADPAAP